MLTVGTSNGFAVLEKSADSWQVVRQALDGSRVEAVGRAGSSILAATEQGVYESKRRRRDVEGDAGRRRLPLASGRHRRYGVRGR